MSKRYRFGMCALLAVVLAAGGVLAGDLTPPGPPGGTMRTLQEIYDKIEAIGGYVGFEGGDALASEILSGRKAWVGGAEVTGTMPNVGQQNLTPGTATQTITQGYHDGTGSVAGDADLVTGNIRAGVNIFGITGDANVVNTSSGDATAGDLLAGKKAWVDGAEVTGTIATWTLSAANDTVQAGYYAATTLSAVDADLAAANIKAGVNVFGVAGSVVESTGNATVGQVLAGATFSKSGESGLTGTMPNVGQQNLTPGTATQTITQGYHDGTGEVDGDADLVTGNIRAGVNIFGITGDANVVNTSSGNATAGDLLAGKKAWVDGAEVTGTIATWTLSAANDTVQAGYYAATTLSAVDADLAAANIKAGVNVFGVAGSVVESTGNATVGQVLAGATFSKAGEAGLTGTMPNVGQQNLTPGTATQTITQGYHDGTGSVAGDADLVAGNIKKDVTIFGVTGTHEGGGGGTYNAAVPKTGQTTSYLTGDDGAHQKGVAWPNPRFTDHSNGTVTDNLTGLMWVKAPHSLPGNSGTMTWNNAIDFCNVLSFAGHSDWRLPNVRELQSLIDYGRSWPALPSGHPFTGVQSDWYWSSSTIADFTGYAWRVYLYFGLVNDVIKTGTCSVWPVRAGQ